LFPTAGTVIFILTLSTTVGNCTATATTIHQTAGILAAIAVGATITFTNNSAIGTAGIAVFAGITSIAGLSATKTICRRATSAAGHGQDLPGGTPSLFIKDSCTTTTASSFGSKVGNIFTMAANHKTERASRNELVGTLADGIIDLAGCSLPAILSASRENCEFTLSAIATPQLKIESSISSIRRDDVILSLTQVIDSALITIIFREIPL
jgi:hypothetical protein